MKKALPHPAANATHLHTIKERNKNHTAKIKIRIKLRDEGIAVAR
jgi:hypothetical protein